MLIKISITILLLLYMAGEGISYSDEQLADIERREYGQVYENDSLSTRLMRLETDLLGMSQSGDIDSRIDMLSRMSNAYNNVNPVNYENEYGKTKKKGAIREFWDNITSPNIGGITGYTPAIDTYGNNIYRNEFTNFTNNSGGYNPYFGHYNTSGIFDNGIFYNYNRNPGYRANLPRHRYNRNPFKGHYKNAWRPSYRQPYYGRSPYGNINRIPDEIYTNTITRSGVKIIKD